MSWTWGMNSSTHFIHVSARYIYFKLNLSVNIKMFADDVEYIVNIILKWSKNNLKNKY